MNIIKDGISANNQVGHPHEHFRSTGIRDNNVNRPNVILYEKVEKELFGGNKWLQWSPKQIRRFVNLFDRSPDKCKYGKNVFCSNDQANNINPKTFSGSLHNMLKEFHDPATGLITQDRFKAMWLKNEFPSYTACKDSRVGFGLWSDSNDRTCAWYAGDANRCTQHGSRFARAGYTANTACCACGGGEKPKGYLPFEPAAFRSFSLEQTEREKHQNAFCRDGFYKNTNSSEKAIGYSSLGQTLTI